MYLKKEFVHQVGKKKDYHYIKMHGQQNVKMCAKMVGNTGYGLLSIEYSLVIPLHLYYLLRTKRLPVYPYSFSQLHHFH